MARNQVWDSKGNLIEDIEVPDEKIIDPGLELTKAISAATTLAQLKDALTGKYGIAKIMGERK